MLKLFRRGKPAPDAANQGDLWQTAPIADAGEVARLREAACLAGWLHTRVDAHGTPLDGVDRSDLRLIPPRVKLARAQGVDWTHLPATSVDRKIAAALGKRLAGAEGDEREDGVVEEEAV